MKFKWYAIQLVIICVIIYILQFLIPNLTEEFALVSSEVLYRPWIIVTSIFLHAVGYPPHLIYNMIALALFGSILERIIGGKNFLIVFFVSGIVASFGSVLFYTASIGASGAIFGVMGALAALRPRMTIFIGYIPMPMALAVVLWAIGNFVGLFSPDEIAYAVHLFGLGFGLIVGFYLRKWYGEKRMKRRRHKISEEEFRTWEEKWMII